MILQEPIYIVNGTTVSARITDVIDANLTDRLDGTLTLDFTTKTERMPEISKGTKIEYGALYFAATQVHTSISGGAYLTAVSCEHFSISLVDEPIEEFVFTGPARSALDRLLEGTGYFGRVEFYGEITISASNTNRRAVLLEIAKLCGGEIAYNGIEIQILQRRGDTEPIDIVQACKCTDIVKTLDPRNGTESYELTGGCADGYGVGDEVILHFTPLGIHEQKRIVGISYNPFNRTTVTVEVGDYITDITDDYAQIDKIFLLKADASIEFEKYINSAEGTAGLKAALKGDFVTKEDLTGYVTTSQLEIGIETYIDGEEGIAKIAENLSGVFVTTSEYNRNVHITATSQVFVKAAGASSYTPSSITLTAETKGEGMTYQWYLGDSPITGATGTELTITADSFSGSSVAYRLVATDADKNTYSDMMTIAKLSDGKDGSPGKAGDPGADGYTVLLSNEFIEVPVNQERKPTASNTYTCAVSVYKGLTLLTANEYSVAVSSVPAGVTATVSGKVVTIKVINGTAISDNGNIELTITIGEMTLTARVTIRANMNALVSAEYQKTVKLDADIEKIIDRETGLAKLKLSASENTTTEITELDVGEQDTGILGGDGQTDVYPFTARDSQGYYTSQNAGQYFSCSYMVLRFNFSSPTQVTFRCVCLGETIYDYGLISNVDCDLTVSYQPDDSEGIISSDVFYSFRGQHSADHVDVVMTIPAGNHYVTIKYVKDGGTDGTGDYFKFRAFTSVFESTSAKSTLTLTQNGVEIASADITFTGFVTFESLSTPGTTTIDGANINTDNLYIKQVYFDDGANSQPIIHSELKENGSGEVFLGFREFMANPANPHILKLYAKDIYFMQPGDNEDSKNTLRFSMTSRSIIANASWKFDELIT